MDKFKLDNKGWGLQAMLACVLVLMIALVIISVMVNKTFEDLLPSPQNPSSSESTKDDVNNEDKKLTYIDMENLVIAAAKKYQKKYYSDMLDGEKISVTITMLKNEKMLLDNIKDVKDDEVCSGYAIFKLKNGNINYSAYLNCSNYKTDGYNEIYDIN